MRAGNKETRREDAGHYAEVRARPLATRIEDFADLEVVARAVAVVKSQATELQVSASRKDDIVGEMAAAASGVGPTRSVRS